MNARQLKKKVVGSKPGAIVALKHGFRMLIDRSGFWLTCPCGYDRRCRGRHGVEIVTRGGVSDAVRAPGCVYDELAAPYLDKYGGSDGVAAKGVM